MKTNNELVIVTGASTGIGRATARQLAGEGFHVLAGVRRNIDGDSLAQESVNIEPIILDITNITHIQALAQRVRADPEGRPLRALINNAGIAVDAPVEVLPIADWKRQFDVAVFGPVTVTQALLPALVASHGRILNIGSLLSSVAMPSSGPYSGAKAAMDAISDALRREVAEFGVDVIVVVPGVVRSKLSERGLVTAALIADRMTPEQTHRYARLIEAHVAQAKSYAKTGIPAETAATVISRAIHASKPRTRYMVGRDAAILTRLARVLPDRALDAILRRQLNSATP
ncbi:SDR family NAD(P)-dependent oxidoreductase [Herbiconiux sp. VKM Ac-1786]|uniref:SDR family NAD(P)-dependent oxidoreductase n=1 Tax=Herbiconiux sp. VKM Ac-1786 TaxID=2783824 RepID=UPI00188A94D4|nr:SDR family NAD(P)-dependent oxidoreductase [Herbiconiux sp. VKM Ac-1786]MBF4571972.1 SDR family NAD(P)-dependent oxidoreductase [Herbiconiux sp. VKM Ac-1786]